MPRANLKRAAVWGAGLALTLSVGCHSSAHPSDGGVEPHEAGAVDDADAALDVDRTDDASDDTGASHVDAASSIDADVSDAPRDDAAAEAGGPVSAPHWRSMRVPLGTDARSAAIELTPDVPAPSISVRTWAAAAETSPNLCFSLEEVISNHADVWVEAARIEDYAEYCSHCSERISVGAGYGLFTLPSGAAARAPLSHLGLRVALRECDTLLPWSDLGAMPSALTVEWAESAPAADAEQAKLTLAVVLASDAAFPAGASDPQLRDALRLVQRMWSAVDISLDVLGPRAMAPPGEAPRFSPSQRAALDALEASAKATFGGGLRADVALLVLTPCLTEDDPLSGSPRPLAGYTPHLPGGFGVRGAADGVFVAVESCGGPMPVARFASADALAAVIAHELGHFLGLYHVLEADGTPDLLADTSAETPNLMQRMPSPDATQLTESQGRAARRHLALARESSLWSTP